MKLCSLCKQFKELTEFHKAKAKKDGRHSYCIFCSNKKTAERYRKKVNPNAMTNSFMKHLTYEKQQEWKKLKLIIKFLKILKKHQNKLQKKVDRQKKKELNKEIKKEHNRDYMRFRLKNDIEFRLLHNLRSRFYNAVKKNYIKGRTIENLGCSVHEFKLYLESQFTIEMSWDNYGSYWEIDHVIPLYTAKNLKEAEALYHYTNMRPLTIKSNRKRPKKRRFTI